MPDAAREEAIIVGFGLAGQGADGEADLAVVRGDEVADEVALRRIGGPAMSHASEEASSCRKPRRAQRPARRADFA